MVNFADIEEFKLVKRAADRDERSMSSFIRRATLAAIRELDQEGADR